MRLFRILALAALAAPVSIRAGEPCDPEAPSDLSAVTEALDGTATEAVQPQAAVWPDPDPAPPASPAPDRWAHRVDLTGGFNPFFVFDPTGAWTKFTIPLEDKTRVLFQNSNTFAFHYDFASQFISDFQGLTREQFDAVTLGGGQPQKALLGAVVRGPWQSGEIGVQLVNGDPLDLETVLGALRLVEANLTVADGTQLLYMPTTEQAEATRQYADQLEAAGFPVASPERWIEQDQCYASGWALGRLKYVPTADIDDAYTRGDLLPTDILLTDRVPAEAPHLAGIVSLRPSTPNSHVAILAQSYGVPFIYPHSQATRDRLRALDGREVSLRTGTWLAGCELTVTATDGLSDTLRAQISSLKQPPTLGYTPREHLGAIWARIDDLDVDSVKHFGGKATGYALLRRALPEENTPKAVAFSFDLFDRFLAQPEPGDSGRTLAQEIERRLAPYHDYPPQDLPGLRDALDDVRDMIRDAPFPDDLFAEVKEALAGFDSHTKIRFRSSTNVEDGATFVGAGLYDSNSGCLADDLDGDDDGPSACDPERNGERGVKEAIQRTLRSFYRDNAWLERVRRGVDEKTVGMAMLAHASYPDEREAANGVATLEIAPGRSYLTIKMVSQLGAVSIANPEPGAPQPEVVRVSISSFNGTDNVSVGLEQSSTHPDVRRGDTVMSNPSDYAKLGKLFKTAAERYVADHGVTESIQLDLEYKKVARTDDDGFDLIVKQIRPLPDPARENVPAVVLADTTRLVISQGEFGNVFSNHALKSRWTVSTDSRWLSGPNASTDSSMFTSVKIEYVKDGEVHTLEGKPSELAGAAFNAATNNGRINFTDTWNADLGRSTLSSELSAELPGSSGPLSTVADASMGWSMKLADPFLTVGRTGFDPNTGQPIFDEVETDEASVRLVRPSQPESRIIDRWTFETAAGGMGGGPVKIEPRYRYNQIPPNIIIKTYSLAEWDKTTITGLTTQPLELTGYFSQTMRPGHHNFSEQFIFEPRLDPNVSDAQKAELAAQDIEKIYVDARRTIHIAGLDGHWRKLDPTSTD